MRIAVALLAILAAGCATGEPRWVRADGSPGSQEQLERDVMECFPTTPRMGPGTVAREDAKDCMRSKGWKRPSS
jgi:hypothetical protein